MANSVDPDKSVLKEQSDVGLHCLHMSEILENIYDWQKWS